MSGTSKCSSLYQAHGSKVGVGSSADVRRDKILTNYTGEESHGGDSDATLERGERVVLNRRIGGLMAINEGGYPQYRKEIGHTNSISFAFGS